MGSLPSMIFHSRLTKENSLDLLDLMDVVNLLLSIA